MVAREEPVEDVRKKKKQRGGKQLNGVKTTLVYTAKGKKKSEWLSGVLWTQQAASTSFYTGGQHTHTPTGVVSAFYTLVEN